VALGAECVLILDWVEFAASLDCRDFIGMEPPVADHHGISSRASCLLIREDKHYKYMLQPGDAGKNFIYSGERETETLDCAPSA
jgi:hypothetical protein